MSKPRSGFVAPYKWDESRICMIKHQHGGFLRANPKNHQECNFKGGQTDWSKWKIYLNDNAKIVLDIYFIYLFIYLFIYNIYKYIDTNPKYKNKKIFGN